MGAGAVLERGKVREWPGVFASHAAANPAVDDLLLAGFDRADIDAVAEGETLRRRIGDIPVPAPDLADVTEASRQEFVAPEDNAGIFALCVSVAGCLVGLFGAMISVA